MSLTIEQYVEQIYRIKAEIDPMMKRNIEVIHSEIVNRVSFGIPMYHVNSYNLNSCIVPLSEGTIYHIVDHSIFYYMQTLLSAFEYDQPNLGISIYNLMRHDICMERYEDEKAEQYKQAMIYYTEYDAQIEELRLNNNEDKNITKFTLMVRFYFLHEYAHYLFAKPMRDTDTMFFDYLVEIFTQNIISDVKKTENGKETKLMEQMFIKYINEYKNNPNFKEEILCDLQSACCLLESSIYYEVDTIFYSIIDFIYTQYFIWLAKSSDTDADVELGNIFHFRINIIIRFAYWLEDDEFSGLFCTLLNDSNRFNNLQNLKCKPINTDRYLNIYNAFTRMLMIDEMGISTSCAFVGGSNSDIIDMSNIKPHTTFVYTKD